MTIFQSALGGVIFERNGVTVGVLPTKDGLCNYRAVTANGLKSGINNLSVWQAIFATCRALRCPDDSRIADAIKAASLASM